MGLTQISTRVKSHIPDRAANAMIVRRAAGLQQEQMHCAFVASLARSIGLDLKRFRSIIEVSESDERKKRCGFPAGLSRTKIHLLAFEAEPLCRLYLLGVKTF
jgi:hypothetical protein